MSNGWTPSSPCAPPTVYLPLGGGTMTGPITLAADPVGPMDAATKQYVDTTAGNLARIGDNRIINGDMRIDQRNGGVGGTAAGYTVDRWAYATTQVGKIRWSRAAAGVSIGFPYCLSFASTSAYTASAADTFAIYQAIEADMVSDFAWGTAYAQPVTLSFWVQSTLTGTFSGAIRNGPTANRSYLFTYSIPTANVMSKVVVVIPGDTSGAWTVSGNGTGVSVLFDLGSGSSFRAPAGAWANANYLTATSAVSVVATSGANFFVTGVKLEIGSVATPFNRQSLAKSMADCQRYYQGPGLIEYVGYSTTGATVGVGRSNPVVMRAAPTLIITDTSGCNNITTPTSVNAFGPGDVFGLGNVLATGTYTLNYKFTASAEL